MFKQLILQLFHRQFISLYQQTPLHIAASKGHDYLVERLVKKGAGINIKDKKGVGEIVHWQKFGHLMQLHFFCVCGT